VSMRPYVLSILILILIVISALGITLNVEGRIKTVTEGFSGAKVFLTYIGFKPKDATNWIVAQGSTKTFSLLVNTTEAIVESNGYGAIEIWVWLFSPSGDGVKLFRIVVKDLQTGEVVSKDFKCVKAPNSNYYQIHVLIKAKPSRYRLYAYIPINDEMVKLHTDIHIKKK